LMKSRFQALWLYVCAGALLLLAMGCNDTLRQFITPIPPPTGDPGTPADAVTLSNNPVATNPGSNMHINVSGDTSVGIVPLGLDPVFLGKAGGNAVVINHGDVSNPPTVTVYAALAPQSVTPTTVTLPNPLAGPIAAGTSSTGNLFIANNLSDSVDVISLGVVAQTQTVPLAAGAHPVMIAGNASNSQIFVINNGNGVANGTVTQISTIDNTIVGNPIPVGKSPIWGVMSADGLFVFVVNQGDGTVTVIDTSQPSPPTNSVIATITVGVSPNFAFYEPKLRRLYVSNTGSNFISVINANGISAANPPTTSIPIPVASHVAGTNNPTSVTALSNGTKAYVALGNCPAGVNHTNLLPPTNNIASCNGNLVSVIDTIALQETKTIQVGAGAVSIDSSSDASRVYVISVHDITTIRDDVHKPNCTDTDCLAGPVLPDRTFVTPSISIIRTSTDSVVVTPVNPGIVNTPLPTFHVPQQDPNCVPTIDPSFNDDVPLPCPLQTPFVVRTFP
jgi:YVTN family beta-propeller protein